MTGMMPFVTGRRPKGDGESRREPLPGNFELGRWDGQILGLFRDPIPERLQIADLLSLRKIGESVRLPDGRVVQESPLPR